LNLLSADAAAALLKELRPKRSTIAPDSRWIRAGDPMPAFMWVIIEQVHEILGGGWCGVTRGKRTVVGRAEVLPAPVMWTGILDSGP
jgi:hypothetical protein